MYNHLLYFLYWVINSLVLYLFSLLVPSYVILGNYRFGGIESAVYAGFWITFFVWAFWDFALAKGLKFESSVVTLGYFWLVNAFAFWIVSRFSQIAGFGVSNYLWTFTLGLVAYIFQRIAWRLVLKRGV